MNTVVCRADAPLIAPDIARERLSKLEGWELSEDGREIRRVFEVKGFAKACHLANLAAWLASQTGHHPDIRFGWGYCTVVFTSHEAGGLTEADLSSALKFNALLDAAA